MKLDWLSRITLAMIAISLALVAMQPWFQPTSVFAQDGTATLYIEPGTTMIQAPDRSSQFYGKVVVDLQNGKIWGFPTLSTSPYPVDNVHTTPPVSHPIYLGKFDLAAMAR